MPELMIGRKDPLHVVIGVVTYRRPHCLERLLPILIRQCAERGAEILIVDNDPLGSAEAVTGRWRDHRIRYVREDRPGLATVRNRALDEARHADLLIFIDDDVVPSPGWLRHLVDCWEKWPCAAVTGPVRWVLPDGADPWLHASGAFDRQRRGTGAEQLGAATNNLLLDMGAIKRLGLRFDERFGLSGGEDTMFSHELIHRGGVIRWCDEAEVAEIVPEARSNRRWALRRAFRAGTTWSRIAILLAGSSRRRGARRIELICRGVVRALVGGAAFIAGSVTRDMRRRASGISNTASGSGIVAGAFGYTFLEYARSRDGQA